MLTVKAVTFRRRSREPQGSWAACRRLCRQIITHRVDHRYPTSWAIAWVLQGMTPPKDCPLALQQG